MRYLSVDILRTAAIVLMVLVHFFENLSGYIWSLGGFGAALFTFLSGASYRLWLTVQQERGRSEDEISKRTIRRGLFLLGVGFAFNILVWLPEDTFNWDVLTFIGAALIALDLMRRLPLLIPLVVSVAAFVISPVLRQLTDYPAYWTNGYFECDLTLSDVVLGFLVNGFFPFLPWILYPLVGYVVASVMCTRRSEYRLSPAAVMGIGAVMIVASVLAIQFRSALPEGLTRTFLTGWSMFPPSPEYIFRSLGIAVFSFGLLHRLIDLRPDAGSASAFQTVFLTFSKHSLSIYLLHHIVHLWPLWIYGVATGNEATHYWQNALPWTASLVLSLVFLVLAYFLFRWMDREKKPGVESMMRWLCD